MWSPSPQTLHPRTTIHHSLCIVGAMISCFISSESQRPLAFPVQIPEPLLRIELEETSCWTFDWANSELIAIGTTNGDSISLRFQPPHLRVQSGTIAVYDIGTALKAITDAGHLFYYSSMLSLIEYPRLHLHHGSSSDPLPYRSSICHPWHCVDQSATCLALWCSPHGRKSYGNLQRWV